MGLYLKVKNHKGISCSYSTFYHLCEAICGKYYGEKMLSLFKRSCLRYLPQLEDEDVEYWNAHCNDDVDILILHSDCDGKLTPKECRRVYNAIKDIKIEVDPIGYYEALLEDLKELLLFCARHRVNMWFC